MATYKYTGEVPLDFPTLVLTVKPNDTFEAPEGLISDNIVSVSTKSATPAKSDLADTTVGA